MIMAALSPKARALVQDARSALRAQPADRERVEAALRARLGPSALPPETGVGSLVGRASWHAGSGAVIGAVIGVALVGGALWLALRPVASPPVPRASVQPASAPAAVAAPSVPRESASGASTPAESPADSPMVASARSAPPARATDGLAEEVALLSRATSALRSGRATEALKALDEHQRRFPSGALSEERRAAKAQALCSLGRVREGRAELGHLAPQSPAAARAKQGCDSVSAAAERR